MGGHQNQIAVRGGGTRLVNDQIGTHTARHRERLHACRPEGATVAREGERVVIAVHERTSAADVHEGREVVAKALRSDRLERHRDRRVGGPADGCRVGHREERAAVGQRLDFEVSVPLGRGPARRVWRHVDDEKSARVVQDLHVRVLSLEQPPFLSDEVQPVAASRGPPVRDGGIDDESGAACLHAPRLGLDAFGRGATGWRLGREADDVVGFDNGGWRDPERLREETWHVPKRRQVARLPRQFELHGRHPQRAGGSDVAGVLCGERDKLERHASEDLVNRPSKQRRVRLEDPQLGRERDPLAERLEVAVDTELLEQPEVLGDDRLYVVVRVGHPIIGHQRQMYHRPIDHHAPDRVERLVGSGKQDVVDLERVPEVKECDSHRTRDTRVHPLRVGTAASRSGLKVPTISRILVPCSSVK